MTTCQHDLAERETACADGHCPICQVAITRHLRGLLDAAEARIAQVRADVDVGMKVVKEQIRRAAYEDAAKVCEQVDHDCAGEKMALHCAEKIRERATAKP